MPAEDSGKPNDEFIPIRVVFDSSKKAGAPPLDPAFPRGPNLAPLILI